MLTATIPWLLMVRLQSPIHPEAHQRWDRNYGSIATAQDCEAAAKQNWKAYYNTYGNDVNTWEYTLTTTCRASKNHYAWLVFVVCDYTGNCHRTQWEGKE